ncbi:MAG: hypothetical protein CMJ25_01030 [Phycisphaerae bacterium]|nr:hypothetical protein [Phycisphaerae bacterium]|tara:strand:- start:3546 stop:3731 length:186 start_codon:yes stop_codon:yes gene_type:complete
MFDEESKIQALVDNYGLNYLLEDNQISENFVVKYLIEEGMIELDNYFNFDAEMKEWMEWEE